MSCLLCEGPHSTWRDHYVNKSWRKRTVRRRAVSTSLLPTLFRHATRPTIGIGRRHGTGGSGTRGTADVTRCLVTLVTEWLSDGTNLGSWVSPQTSIILFFFLVFLISACMVIVGRVLRRNSRISRSARLRFTPTHVMLMSVAIFWTFFFFFLAYHRYTVSHARTRLPDHARTHAQTHAWPTIEHSSIGMDRVSLSDQETLSAVSTPVFQAVLREALVSWRSY